MSSLVKNTVRFVLFILVQVYVLFQINPLHQFIVPYLYFLYLLWLPFNTPRLSLTMIGFVFGLSLDYFSKTPGLHAASCVLIAYLRPFLINILIRQEGSEQNYRSPSVTSMGLAPYATYVIILTLVHNGYNWVLGVFVLEYEKSRIYCVLLKRFRISIASTAQS